MAPQGFSAHFGLWFLLGSHREDPKQQHTFSSLSLAYAKLARGINSDLILPGGRGKNRL